MQNGLGSPPLIFLFCSVTLASAHFHFQGGLGFGLLAFSDRTMGG